MNAPNELPVGWYPDPLGRYEHRYWNGQRWTADVSTGGQRQVDHIATSHPGVSTQPPGITPPGVAPAGYVAPARKPKRGKAIASFVLALSALLLGWAPIIFAVAFVAAVLAVVFGVLALVDVKRGTGGGRGFALTGLVLAPFAIAMCVVGFLFTRAVLREFDEFTDVGPYQITENDPCTVAGGLAEHTGTIRNVSDETRSYTITVEFRSPDGRKRRVARTSVDDVEPSETRTWQVATLLDGSDDGDGDCSVTSVQGPFPFGLDPEG